MRFSFRKSHCSVDKEPTLSAPDGAYCAVASRTPSRCIPAVFLQSLAWFGYSMRNSLEVNTTGSRIDNLSIVELSVEEIPRFGVLAASSLHSNSATIRLGIADYPDQTKRAT